MSVDLEEKDFKRKLTMKKEDAEKILWSFYHRNIGDSSPVVAVSGRGYRYYITLAKSEDDVTIELWYENDCFDNNKGAFFCISLGYIGGNLAGVLCISDPPRDEAAEAIRMLRERGIKHVAMITGDSQKAAERTAQLLGIDTFFAQVLPEDKHRYVEKMKAEGRRVIMVGDGINDAPALAAANVSVAMSDASDIARETADVTLRSEDLRDLAELRTLSTQLMERIQANYRFIVAFNTSLLAAGFFGLLAPSTSALLHNLSTMGICAKSMTPLKQK